MSNRLAVKSVERDLYLLSCFREAGPTGPPAITLFLPASPRVPLALTRLCCRWARVTAVYRRCRSGPADSKRLVAGGERAAAQVRAQNHIQVRRPSVLLLLLSRVFSGVKVCGVLPL